MKNKLYENNEVFVVPFSNTMSIENGFTFNTKDKKNIWSKYDSLGMYMQKNKAEGNPEVQQLIPYIMIRSDLFNYYVLELKNHIKDDYKNTMTLGLCDHIDYLDGLKEPLFKASIRCLFNHVDINELKSFNFKGYVRDMGGDVNDHLGVVFLIDGVKEDDITLKTSDFIGKWMTINELIEHYGKFENWSKYLIDYMVDKTL